jgi:hypothetical protein
MKVFNTHIKNSISAPYKNRLYNKKILLILFILLANNMGQFEIHNTSRKALITRAYYLEVPITNLTVCHSMRRNIVKAHTT